MILRQLNSWIASHYCGSGIWDPLLPHSSALSYKWSPLMHRERRVLQNAFLIPMIGLIFFRKLCSEERKPAAMKWVHTFRRADKQNIERAVMTTGFGHKGKLTNLPFLVAFRFFHFYFVRIDASNELYNFFLFIPMHALHLRVSKPFEERSFE